MRIREVGREALLFVRDVVVTTSVIFVISLSVGIMAKPSVDRHLASTISEQSQAKLREYGYDIFKEPPEIIPGKIRQELSKKDDEKLDLIDRIKRFPDIDWIEMLLRWSGILGLLRGAWRFLKRKLGSVG